ncbi:hypothetical protein EXIGLDRAFT_835255 [Exidia glandulosa HHB12029]|uniref:Uncharacterized protein n=1 Tax=Exidia glandulosa HHB12029 TaxID=1314781 RepID=A0A166APY8_EXIGL|nr:hypothetical protein EXIGLDRAFT_835255 [Exidia glandulosa HHB12029]
MAFANFQPTTTELALSNQIFLLADPQKIGIITGDAAIKVFGGAGLSNTQLGEIWAIADSENNGWLSRKGVAVALRLIAWAQKGETPTVALLAKPGPVAQIEGVSSSLPKPPASPGPKSPQPTGAAAAASSSLHPPLLPQDRAKFLKLFNSSGPVNGILPGEKAREIFLKSKLPYERLAQIWNLADTRTRGALDSTDFIIAMYLIQASMSNTLPTLPAVVSPVLYEVASGGVVSHSTGASSVSAASPIAAAFNAPKPIPRNLTGQSSFASPQLTGQVPAARPPPPAIPPRNLAFPLAAPPPPVPQHWDVSAQEKASSDAFFDQLDPQRTGFVGGDVAGPFLVESTLSEDVLAQVWDLVDSRGEGRLSRDQFAVVMHLINSKLAGRELPAVLPPSLVPPSMRGSAIAASAFPGAASAFQQPVAPPPPQPERDLFSLDDSPPPSAIQPPVQPQYTGMSQQMTGNAKEALPRQITGQQSPPIPQAFPEASPFGQSAVSSPYGQSAAASPFGQPAAASPFGQPAAASPFGQPAFAAQQQPTVNQFQHRPAPPPPQQQPHKNLLDDEEETPNAAAQLQTSAEIGNVKIQLASTERTLESTRQEREITEKTIESNAAQLAALQTQLASAKASYETESNLLTTLKERYTEQTAAISKTREELIAAESDLSAIKLEKTEVGGAALRDKDEVRALQKKMKDVADATEALKAELEKAKKDARQQKGLLAIAKKQLASAEADRARVLKELEEAQAEAAAEKKEVDEVNQAIEKLNAAAAIAPVPAAPSARIASPSLPVEEAAIPLPPTATGTPVPAASPAAASLNPFAKLARQDTLAGGATPPRVMSPFGALPFATTAIPTPPIGPAASPAPEVAAPTAPAATEVEEPAPMSATSAGDDPFGLDKFDEVFSTPTEGMSPMFTTPPPGLDAFAVANVAGSPPALETKPGLAGLAEPAVAEGQAQFDEVSTHFPAVDAVPAVPAAIADAPASGEDLPPIKDLEPEDDTSSDEDEAGGKFTHITKPSDSDDWASAKENAEAAPVIANGDAEPTKPGPSFDDLFAEPAAAPAPAAAADSSAPLARAKSLSPATSNASSPRRPVSVLRSLSSTSLGATDPFGAPQSFDATPFEPPVGEHVPPPIIETVLEPSPAAASATTAATTSGVSDFDEAMGRLPGSGPEPTVQFSSAFDDNFDFGSAAFEPAPAPAAAPAAANGAVDKGGFDDVFGLNGTTPDATVAFPSVGSPVLATSPPVENKAAPTATFDDVFGTSEPPVAESSTGKANGHAANDSMSTTETGSTPAQAFTAPARPLSPATSGSHGVSTPPRQASPPPAGMSRSTSMRFRSSSPKPKDKAKAKESPEAPRHSKLSLSFFGRKDKKDKKSKKDAQQHLEPPTDDAANGARTPAAEDDIDGVKQLCAMGFSRTQAIIALEKHGYDVQLALNSLLQ